LLNVHARAEYLARTKHQTALHIAFINPPSLLMNSPSLSCSRCGDVHAPAEYLARTKHQTALHIACAHEQYGKGAVAEPRMVIRIR
jgi:hypothetical protein